MLLFNAPFCLPTKIIEMLTIWEDWCDDWSTVLWRTGDQTNMAVYPSSVSSWLYYGSIWSYFLNLKRKNIVFAENATKMLE